MEKHLAQTWRKRCKNKMEVGRGVRKRVTCRLEETLEELCEEAGKKGEEEEGE